MAEKENLVRLYNAHTAPIGGVLPGQVGVFDLAKASTRAWLQPAPDGRRVLIAESEVLASKAGALVPTASAADLLRAREEVKQKDAAIAELLAREKGREEEVRRIGSMLSEAAAATEKAAKLEVENERLAFDLASAKTRLEGLDALVSEMHAKNGALQSERNELAGRIAGLEAALSSATAPTAEVAKTDDPPVAPPARASRRG